MRESKSWVDVIHPAAHLGAEGELERHIKRIQADALRHAAEIATNTQKQLWQIDSRESEATRWIERDILAKAKELEP